MESPTKGKSNVKKAITLKMSEDASNVKSRDNSSRNSCYKTSITPMTKTSNKKAERTPIYMDPQRNEEKTSRSSKTSREDYTITDDPFKKRLLLNNYPSSVLSCKHPSHCYDGRCTHLNRNEEPSGGRSSLIRHSTDNRSCGQYPLYRRKEEGRSHNFKQMYKQNPLIPDFIERKFSITHKVDEGVQVLLKTTQRMVDKGENTVIPFQPTVKKNSNDEPLEVDDHLCDYHINYMLGDRHCCPYSTSQSPKGDQSTGTDGLKSHTKRVKKQTRKSPGEKAKEVKTSEKSSTKPINKNNPTKTGTTNSNNSKIAELNTSNNQRLSEQKVAIKYKSPNTKYVKPVKVKKVRKKVSDKTPVGSSKRVIKKKIG